MEFSNIVTHRGLILYVQLLKEIPESTAKLTITKVHVDLSENVTNKEVVCERSCNIAKNNVLTRVKIVKLERKLYILVFESFEQSSIVKMIWLYSFSKNKLELVSAVNLPDKINLKLNPDTGYMENGLFKLISESFVVITHGKHLYIANITNNCFNVIESRKIQVPILHVRVCRVDKYATSCNAYLILLITDQTIVSFVLYLGSKEKVFYPINESTLFIPNIYVPVLVNILTTSCSSMETDHQNPPRIMSFHATVYLATSKKQILKFENGSITSCVPIPFSDTKDMLTLENSVGDGLLIVFSRTGKLCIISDNQIINVIDGIKECFVDDFVGCGSQQLLAFPYPVWQQNDAYLLTDNACYHTDRLSTSNIICAEQKEESESLTLVVKALQSKLQRSMSELQRAEQVYCHKETLIQKSCAAIENMTTGMATHKIQGASHLIPLIGNKPSSREPKPADVCNPFISGEPWQRVVEQNWVVGITVTNTSNRPLYDISMFLTPENTTLFPQKEITSSSSACLSYKSSKDIDLEPAAKKARLDFIVVDSDSNEDGKNEIQVHNLEPKSTVYLTLCSDLPQFDICGSKSYSLTLGWSDYTTEEKQNTESKDPRERQYRSMVVGRVSICASDVLAGKYECPLNPEIDILSGVEKRRNLLSLDMCQQISTLQIRSTFSQCQCLLEVLHRHLGGVHVTEYCQHVITGSRPLSGVRVKAIDMCTNQATIAVHTRDDNQLLLLIHSLYQYLPDDVIIQPANQNDQNKLIGDALSSMQKELSTIKSSTKQIIKNTEQKSSEMTTQKQLSMEVTNDHEKARSDFKAKQEETRNRSADKVDNKDFEKIVQTKQQLEKQTDSNVEKLGTLL